MGARAHRDTTMVRKRVARRLVRLVIRAPLVEGLGIQRAMGSRTVAELAVT
jgi:hypothetical protein